MEKIDLVDEKDVVEVVNSYLSIPVASFDARKIEQVEIPPRGLKLSHSRLTLMRVQIRVLRL